MLEGLQTVLKAGLHADLTPSGLTVDGFREELQHRSISRKVPVASSNPKTLIIRPSACILMACLRTHNPIGVRRSVSPSKCL